MIPYGCQVTDVEGHKDITEMSFEEFFSESKVKSEKSEIDTQAPPRAVPKKTGPQNSQRAGFGGSGPKINYTAGRFQLYIPRYSGKESDRFEVAVDCAAGVIPMGHIDSVKQKGGRTTRPATIDLTTAGVSPLESFTVTIDGEEVFVNKPRSLIFFNNIGLPLNKPAGDVFAVHPSSTDLRLVKAEVLGETTKGDVTITRLEVSLAGGVWIQDSEAPAPSDEAGDAVEPIAPVEGKPTKKAQARKVRVKGSLGLSAGCKDADVRFNDEVLPMYTGPFQVFVDVEGCQVQDCKLSVSVLSEEVLSIMPEHAVSIDVGDRVGPVDVTLEREGKVLDSKRAFVIPGLAYRIPGKGDLSDDPSVELTIFGSTVTADAGASEVCGPFERDGMSFSIEWMVPVVGYDIGDGMRHDIPCEVNISDIQGDALRVSITGARKKSIFFGGENGKKRDVTPEWSGQTYDIDLSQIREEVYSNPSSTFCFYITVNSFPNRKFMTIRNPVRIKAVFNGSEVSVDIDPSVGTGAICRLYRMDRTESDVPLVPGNNLISVDADVIDADVIESVDGRSRVTVPVVIRSMPFLHRDQTGDYWLYVSRSKRIPLPDGLIVDGKPDYGAVKAWHDRIVRMNPELRSVTYPMMQKAFADMGE